MMIMTILPFFFHMRVGGGIPLDSQTKVMRPPTVTVRGDTSSEPRILGGTEVSERERQGFRKFYKVKIYLITKI